MELPKVVKTANSNKKSSPWEKVVIIDDLIATGGTLKAAEALVGQTAAQLIGSLCLIEIDFLKGKEGVKSKFVSLIHV